MDANQYDAKLFSGPRVSVTPHDQACRGAPTLLIKYPQVALVFQWGCFLSVHYWHVFNNSWGCTTEDSAQGPCCAAADFVIKSDFRVLTAHNVTHSVNFI